MLLLQSKLIAQHTEIQSSFSNNLTACLNETQYSVSINNVSPYSFFDSRVKIILPQGITYVAGSVGGATEAGRNGDTLFFDMPGLSSLTNTTVSIRLSAMCMESYIAKKNIFLLDYNGRNAQGALIHNVVRHESNLYTINAPDLSLVSMSNQSISGNIGDVFTRCIRITNGGSGSLSTFTLKHLHGSGLEVQSADKGTLTVLPTGTTHTFTAADFANVGNGNTTLDPGESIVICETILINSCSNAQSNYKYSWGCNDEICQELSDAANVVFDAETPHLRFTPWASFTNNATNGLGANCYGNNTSGDFPSSLTITNDGQGKAINTLIKVGGSYTGNNSLVITDYFSSINIASLTIEINGGGPQALIPSRTYNGQSKSCLPANPKNGFEYVIPEINPNDVIVIRWNHFTCCSDNCDNGNRRHLLHWRYEGNYENNCGDSYPVPLSGALPSTGGTFYYRNQMTPDVVPGTMINNETARVTFMAVNSEFPLPRNSSDEFKYRVTLPDACLNVNTNSLIVKNHLGVIQNPTYTSSVDGNIVEFIFPSITMGNQWTITFDVTLDCASCITQGSKTLSFETLYRPSDQCNCWQRMGCTSARIDALCPPLCEGANLVSSNLRRINLGLPDNDNNGLPDAGPHNMNLVRTDRVMHGDTLEITSSSAVYNPNNLNFVSAVQTNEIVTYGNRMSYSFSTVRIYQAATNSYFTSGRENLNTNVNLAGGITKWTNAFNIQNINSLNLPASTSLSSGDSIFINSYYVNNVNLGGDIVTVNTKTQVKLSTNITPASAAPADLLGCNTINREFSLIGWYYTNYGPNVIETQNCDEITLQQSYYLSIGPCCNNYNGGNLFPYEYRHWSSPANMFVELPDDYEYISASFSFSSTAGTLTSRGIIIPSITPVSVTGRIYEFDLSGYFGPAGSGAAITYGDDGFSGTIYVRVRPTCAVENTTKNTRYRWAYNPVAQINPNEYELTGWLSTDPVTYNGPILTMQSNILYVNSQTGQETWDLFFQNTSFESNVNNFWIAAPSNAAITGDSLLNLATNTWYFPNANGIFDVQDIPASSSVTYRLFTTISSCTPANINVYSGWGCSGTPAIVSDYQCTPLSLTLRIEPLTPSFESQVTIPSIVNAELCEEVDVEVLIRNYQLGYGFDLKADIILPYGMDIIPGSSILHYLGQTTTISDPLLVSGTTFQWDFTSSPTFANGLVGIVDGTNNFYKITFKVKTMCGYNSGQRVFARGKGNSFCGSFHQSELNYSPPIFVNSMTSPYETKIRIGIDFITPCGPDNNTQISVKNNGPNAFGNADSLTYVLPAGLTYMPNSFSSIHNANITQTEPRIYSSGTQTMLVWPLQPGVAMNDSMKFLVNLLPTPADIPCEITELRAFTNVFLTASCAIDGNVCEAGLITGEQSKSIYVYKTFFRSISSTSNVHLNTNGTESVTGSVRFENLGAPLSSNYPIIYQIINDIDGNGNDDLTDPIIKSDTLFVNVDAGGFFNVDFSVLTPNFCGGFVRFFNADNPCFCNTQVVQLTPTYSAENFRIITCDNEDTQLSYNDIGGYTYNWTSTQFLNNITNAQALFNHNQVVTSPIDFTYIRTINKGLCAHKDTSYVRVMPHPSTRITISDTTVCQESGPFVVPFENVLTAYDQILTFMVNGQTQTRTFRDNALFTFDTDTIGQYHIVLVKIEGVDSLLPCTTILNQEITVHVNPLPTATSFGDTTICKDTDFVYLTLEGGNATEEYTFDYLLDGTPAQGTTTNGQLQILIPTLAVGTVEIQTLQITEASVAACSTTPTLRNLFVVLPLPSAQVQSDTIVCEGDPSVAVTFSGSASSVNDYTFFYELNGIPQQGTGHPLFETFQSTSTPGDYTFNLLRVKDHTVQECTTILDTSIVIKVNPLPTAQLIGDTSVCHFANEPEVTFVGANGTAPYTFTYTIDGIEHTAVALVDSVRIPIQTAQVGTVSIELTKVTDSSPTHCFTSYTSQTVEVIILPNPIAHLEMDSIVCQNSNDQTVTFTGSNATPNYTFTYTLNNGPTQTVTSIGNEATIIIPTSVVGNFDVRLTQIQEASIRTCTSTLDTTIRIEVLPLPEVQMSGTSTVCQLAIAPEISFTPSNSTAPYWIFYTLNGQNDSIEVQNISSTIAHPTDEVGDFDYQLIGIKDGSVRECYKAFNDQIRITVRDLPKATINQDTAICRNAGDIIVNFNGSFTTAPYTFDFNVNGTLQTITSIVDLAEYTQSSALAGEFVYQLTRVTDASPQACARELDTVITITINELPIANIGSDAIICLNEDPAPITFVGELGTPDYTFHYSIIETNEVLSVRSINGLSATVPSINNQVGTFTYHLTGVTDASSTRCFNTLNQVVIIEVKGLPSGEISSFGSICQDDSPQEMIFTGHNGGSPYTFEYNINGNAFSIETIAPDSVVTLIHPSDVPGTFLYHLTRITEADFGCSKELNGIAYAVIHPKPIPHFSFTPTKLKTSESTAYFHNETLLGESYQWYFTENDSSSLMNPHFVFDVEGRNYVEVLLVATSMHGCVDSILQVITIQREPLVYLPNTFTPNGDGLNEIFAPIINEGIELQDFEFTIYNRWGELVFRTVDLFEGWNGTYKGNIVPDGVYSYIVNIKHIGSSVREKFTGHINVLK